MARTGYIDTPDYYEDELYETVGYVERIWVEREAGRDAMFFTLAIYARDTAAWLGRADGAPVRYQKFFVYLDIGTTVALGQLQLLRDAMWSRTSSSNPPYLVRVHFNFKEADQIYAFPYWVGISIAETYPVYVNDFYRDEVGRWVGNWYAHFARME